MSGPPHLDIADGVARITLNRPERGNALSLADLDILKRHLDAAAGQVRALVITGAGARAFSGGVDLAEVIAAGGAEKNPLSVFCDALEAFPAPTIARLNGAVIGGAAEITFACDFRVGADGVRLMVPAARIGLHYERSGLARAAACVGWQAARRIYLLAEPQDQARLTALGYLDRVAPAGALDAAVDEIVELIRGGAPLAVDGMKQTLLEMSRGRGDEAAVRARIAACWASDDLQEGLAAARERRPARFTGR